MLLENFSPGFKVGTSCNSIGTLHETHLPESCLAVFSKTVTEKVCKLCLSFGIYCFQFGML